jgi:hypothetical protein
MFESKNNNGQIVGLISETIVVWNSLYNRSQIS